MSEPEKAPTLPQYPVLNQTIQKPGMLGKMMGKMLKLPKMKMPKHTKMRTRTVPNKRPKKKQPHFY